MRKRYKYGYFTILGSMLRISMKHMPGSFGIAILIMIAAEVSASAGVLVKQNLFDCAQNMSRGSVGKVYLAGILLGVYFIAAMLLQAASRLTYEQGILRLQQEAGNQLHQKVSKIDPICYEDNRFLDDIKRASTGIESAVHVMWVSVNIAAIFLCYYGLDRKSVV